MATAKKGKIQVTKVDAATRQIDTAIALWFSDADPVSIHTLASAAHQIVHDMVQKRGGQEMLFNSLIFKDETRAKAIKHLKGPQNFFKHADKDPDGVFEFYPDNLPMMIFTLLGLEHLGIIHNEVRCALIFWHAISNPKDLDKEGLRKILGPIPPAKIVEIAKLPKSRFFATYCAARKKVVFRSRSAPKGSAAR